MGYHLIKIRDYVLSVAFLKLTSGLGACFLTIVGFSADISQLAGVNPFEEFKRTLPISAILFVLLVTLIYFVGYLIKLRNDEKPKDVTLPYSEENTHNFTKGGEHTIWYRLSFSGIPHLKIVDCSSYVDYNIINQEHNYFTIEIVPRPLFSGQGTIKWLASGVRTVASNELNKTC